MDDKVSVSQTGHRQDESKAVQEDHLERYSAFTERQKLCIIFLVAFAGWFSTLSSFIYFPAITPLAHDLGTTVDKINLSITSYMIVSGLAPSIIGDLADTLTLYFSANIALAVQKSFPALLILRMLQSAGISGKPRAFSVHPVETA
jgi:MFS family permease